MEDAERKRVRISCSEGFLKFILETLERGWEFESGWCNGKALKKIEGETICVLRDHCEIGLFSMMLHFLETFDWTWIGMKA